MSAQTKADPVTIDERQPLAQMIAAGGYAQIYGQITGTTFPLQRGDPNPEREASQNWC